MSLNFYPLVLSLAVLGAGCSSSDDSTDLSEAGSENVQFATPDPAGTSDVARLSYPVVRDLSRELVTGAYLDRYFAIDSQVGMLLYEAVGGVEAVQTGAAAESVESAPFTCPEGGTVSVSFTDRNGPAATFSATFADCGVDGRTLDGALVRDSDYTATGGGSNITNATVFDALDIFSADTGLMHVSGSIMRTRIDSTPETLPQGARGNCALDESNIRLMISSNISFARLEQTGTAGSLSLSESSYERDDSRSYDATSDEEFCPMSRTASESGSTVVTFAGYGASSLDGQARITTEISTDIGNDADIHAATQTSELPDGSTVMVTAVADMNGMTQVDIMADGSAISFIDSYRFVAADFDL